MTTHTDAPAMWVLCAEIAGDFHPESGFVHRDNRPVEPREVFIKSRGFWVREDGSWISGWRDGRHFGFRPALIGRWRLRQAVKKWKKRNGC